MRIYFTLLAVFLAGSWCAYSQVTLSGKVATTQNQPLDGAHIHIDNLHAMSLPDGLYSLPGIPAGSHRVVVSYIGYKSLDTVVDIYRNLVLDAVLNPESTQLQEVVLTETAQAKSTVHEDRLKAETIEKYSNTSLGDALKEIAGVSSLKTGSTIVKPVINGLHSSRVPVISNNVRLEDQQWGTEHAPNLDINSAGRVSVIKGAGALQYGGDAVGGLVLVEPVSVLKDTLFGRTILTADSNGRGGSVTSSLHQGAEKGWAWNASGTFKYMGDRETPDYVLSNTGNREANFASDVKYIGSNYNLQATYSFYNATIGIAEATHIGNVSDLVRAINNQEPSVIRPFTYKIGAPRQEVQHHLAKLNFNKDLADGATLALQYAFQLNRREEFDLRRGDYANIAALDLTLSTHSVNADWKKTANNATYKAGVSGSMQHNDASPATGIRPLIPNYDKLDAGVYGIYQYAFSSSLSGEAGVRYDFSRIDATKYYQKSRWDALGYNGVFDDIIIGDYSSQWLTNPKFTYHNVSASVGLRKDFGNSLTLLGNVSLAMRNPNPSELFSDGLHHSNATIELGDLRTQKEKALKFSATLLKTGSAFSFELTPYLNSINNFIYLSPTGVEYTIRGTFPVYKYMQTNALLAGADLHTDWNITSHLKHSLNAAYLHATNTLSSEPLIDMPPLNITNTLRYTLQNFHSLFAEVRSEAVFTQTRYPNNNFNADVPAGNELVPTLVNISTPPPGYQLLHFTTGAQFALGKTTAAINVSVNNIFNTAYRDYLNRQRLYTDEVGRNFQLQLKLNY
ncbi:TonB-dependent receptor [Flavobacterium zepuense]|uniref:TonB-dependent receptor n=1 Tax=Flavobacterium zepuense TaxID=2593302 RepID=A0A552UW31_9FLAO|nr:TonB-dependent receptor [Flavobacterium zepuense]TRW22419.1 TonB-dependent receptor [Flavobacterium zepuense]